LVAKTPFLDVSRLNLETTLTKL